MNILIYTLKSIAYALTEPYFIILLFILFLVLYRRNKKTTVMQKMILGERINSPFELTISQIVIGIFAGAIASTIMSYLGIVFDKSSSVHLIFLVSIFFMFLNPRFICFAYSGAALAFISLTLGFIGNLFNIPNLDILKIDVVALMSMVAILHFIEGILIIIDGETGYIPVFTSRDDKVIGGFALQRYWVLPIAIIFTINNTSTIVSLGQLSLPDWWPFVKNSIPASVLSAAVITLVPFYGMIGYNSVTFTKSRKEKSLISGIFIIGYSIVLFGFAQIAVYNSILKFLLVIFAPAAHEAIIISQRYLELKGKPKYISDEGGIMVLDVAPNSPANEMGIKTGDILVEVNNKKIESEDKVMESIAECSSFIWFKVKKVTGKFEQVSYSRLNSSKRLGIVFVPRGVPRDSMVVKLDETRFSEVLDKIKNKDKDE